jgi:FG-GAP-like repeat
MRPSWHAWPVGLALILGATSAYAAGTAARAQRPAQPARTDLILARTGIGWLPHGDSRAIASFDYDQDGDLDLFVGTQQGTVIWLNDGVGVFSALPLQWAAPASPTPPQTLVATVVDPLIPLDRSEAGVAREPAARRFQHDVAGLVTSATIPRPPAQISPAGSPRAPPR